ncbi:MAG TPA: 16S rRNA (guanine(527)-N(7))-methyltransferase RsmG [Trichocoleus sp.]|jgi:16S rRNA (guanine527-N7)-methyltransferase
MRDEVIGLSQLPEMSEVWQETMGWQPSVQQQAQLQRLYELVLAGNRQLNLTRITEPQEFWEKHLWDSLRGIKPWLTKPQEHEPQENEPQRIIDIGTGGGFPGIPAAIVRPDWQVTLLDSTRKKLAFVDSLLTALELSNARTWVNRAEVLGQQRHHRAKYDLALIRAVATASVCAEYALPLLKIGGTAVLYRGQWTEAEAIGLEGALQQLGGVIEAIEPFTTPLTAGVRHCLYLKKIEPTEARFPRSVGLAVQRPL